MEQEKNVVLMLDSRYFIKVIFGKGSGEIHSNIETSDAVHGMESLILAHACAGVDIESDAYLEGVQTAFEAIANHVDLT